MDRFLGELSPASFGKREELFTAFDIFETNDRYVVKADIPGIEVKDLDISITDHVLTVQGKKQEELEDKKECYHQTERRFGSFSRSFTLPEDARTEEIDATYRDGVLRLTIPKGELSRPKKIEVKAH
jgi:HSP20 family protein